ncbi:MAG: monovalent cation/H(+) antiporter subunit G [Candidatus Aenigmarchaeota archaeon]|nr:monovalent cation/H(+) antiporter subunit G [Candidatus Aenigmarchaeota archaeon]
MNKKTKERLATGIISFFIAVSVVVYIMIITQNTATYKELFFGTIAFVGSLFALVGSFGLVRFPDVYTRSHAQTLVTVAGVCLILLCVAVDTFFSQFSVKSIFLIIFIFITSPVGTHAITKAAYLSGVKPVAKKDEWKKIKK